MVKDFERAYIYAADQPLVRKIIIAPRERDGATRGLHTGCAAPYPNSGAAGGRAKGRGLMLINLAASPEANVILLVQED